MRAPQDRARRNRWASVRQWKTTSNPCAGRSRASFPRTVGSLLACPQRANVPLPAFPAGPGYTVTSPVMAEASALADMHGVVRPLAPRCVTTRFAVSWPGEVLARLLHMCG